MRISIRFYWAFLSSASFLLAIGVFLARLGQVDGYAVENWSLKNDAGETIRARFYVPEGAGKVPGVLLCHGVTNSN